jgi:hypothetical protein
LGNKCSPAQAEILRDAFPLPLLRKVKRPFKSGEFGYVGFQFSQSGQTHYGWLRLRLEKRGGFNYVGLALSKFGYESTPNTPILAGNCATSAENVKPPSIRTETPESLGLLALGAKGVPLWRGNNHNLEQPAEKSLVNLRSY